MGTKILNFQYQFVEFIPDQTTDGLIYVSIPYATAIHRCACGCGKEVVTPLSPTDWRLIFDGKSISLDPSIGNWSFDCQSHYFIRRNKVLWCEKWTKERIDLGRAYDSDRKKDYFGPTEPEIVKEKVLDKNVESSKSESTGIWNKMRKFFSLLQ